MQIFSDNEKMSKKKNQNTKHQTQSFQDIEFEKKNKYIISHPPEHQNKNYTRRSDRRIWRFTKDFTNFLGYPSKYPFIKNLSNTFIPGNPFYTLDNPVSITGAAIFHIK